MAALGEPIISGGIRHTNYFQGRVLSAEDLATDQTAEHRHLGQLGQAIGAGVIRGLEVMADTASAAPTLIVEPGLALNAEGNAIELPGRASLPLLSDITSASASRDGVFGPCGDAGPGVDLSGDGAYLLVISPGSGFQERAPKVGLEDDGVAGSCGARYLVEGAVLRLLPLPLAGRADIAEPLGAIAALDEPASTAGPEDVVQIVSRFRNGLAHLCLTDAAAAGQAPALRAGAPGVFDADPTILAALRAGETPPLRPCDVPLAVLYLDLFGLRFVDQWAARRLARPRLSPASLSLFPAYGIERVLQFASQLDDILRETGSIANVRIGDYVRYVPPAAWFPAQGSGVAGFSPSQFLAPFTRGAVGRMNAGQLTERLDASLRHAAIDLADGPCLLAYDLDENEAALVTGDAGRRIRFFQSRDVNGPLQRDALALALEGLWEAARGMARRIEGFFVPVQNPATLRQFEGALEGVTDTANRYAAVTLARGFDGPDSLSALTVLLERQRSMADRLAAIQFAAGGAFGQFSLFLTVQMAQFVAGLRLRLDGAIPGGGGPGLAQAIAAGDVCAAIAAQENINTYLGTFSGQAGATGPTDLTFIGSPQGQTVVPGGAAFPHIYEIDNGTDRLLTFQLEASAEATNGDWSSAVTITDPAGGPLTELAVDSGSTARFVVAVAAPGDAVQGETATLNVRALSPPPDLRDLNADALPLTVGDSATDPVEQTISIPEPSDPVLQRTVVPGGFLNLSFTVLYQADNGPDDAVFDVGLVFDDPPDGWLVAIDGGQGTVEGPEGQFTEQITLSSGTGRVVPVSLRAPAAPGIPPVRVRFVARSSSLDTTISAASPPNDAVFTLAVSATA
ncbi:MAG: hypothetical protein AAGK30_00290 [Pseudomonadota bacterium]